MNPAPAQPELAEVIAAHEVYTPRGYANEVCTCGWESDLEKPPEGQGAAHLAAVVADWYATRLGAGPLGKLADEWERPLNGAWQRANTDEDFAVIAQQEAMNLHHANELRATLAAAARQIGGDR